MHSTTVEIKKAAALLRAGKLVAFPTETVYGLGGNALSDEAVAAIYEAKGRPGFNPLIVHVPSLEVAARYGEFNERAIALAKAFWPGPLTLVLKRTKECAISLLASAGMDTLALRMPSHVLAQALLHEAGVPVAAPSANRSGRISPTEAAHVREELGERVAMVLDGGACELGIESTVVDVTGEGAVLLRPGSVAQEELQKIMPLSLSHGGGIKAPGMMESHYAPQKPLRLNAREARAGEALIGFGAIAGEYNLSARGDVREAAANLFRMLRRADAGETEAIAVAPVPEEGLGVAINDRLRRAAVR